MGTTKRMNTNDRRNAIKETVEKEGRVNVVKLAADFGTTQATIRTDLREMEKTHLVERVHGGAISISSAYKSYYDANLNERMNINKDEKLKIAKACMSLIQDGDTILIDSGTTNIYVARELAKFDNLTVLTNALLIAQELFYNPSIKVILLGGDIEFNSQFTYGNDTITQLSKYRANKYIQSIDGVSIDHGITTYHHQEVDVSRLMMERVNQVIALADHSKIGKEGFSFIAPLDSINTLITDSNELNEKVLSEIETRGVEVIRV